MQPRHVLFAAALAFACTPPADDTDTTADTATSDAATTNGTSQGPTTSGDPSATTTTSETDGAAPSTSGESTASPGDTSSAGDTTTADTTGPHQSTGPSTQDDGASSSGDDGPPPDCAANLDCESCGAVDGCGWCGATGTCSAGDDVGPDAGECSGGWEADGDFFSCPAANCWAQTNCADCQDAYIGCGWCASSNTCMPGAPDMPAPGGACADQQWYFDICPEDCADEMTCVSCTGTVGCGWCFASNSCAAGTDVGPLQGQCGGEWSTEVAACF